MGLKYHSDIKLFLIPILSTDRSTLEQCLEWIKFYSIVNVVVIPFSYAFVFPLLVYLCQIFVSCSAFLQILSLSLSLSPLYFSIFMAKNRLFGSNTRAFESSPEFYIDFKDNICFWMVRIEGVPPNDTLRRVTTTTK